MGNSKGTDLLLFGEYSRATELRNEEGMASLSCICPFPMMLNRLFGRVLCSNLTPGVSLYA
jgi:hypothetical protein